MYQKYANIGEFQHLTGLDPARSNYTWDNVGQFDQDVRELCTPAPKVSVKPDIDSRTRGYAGASTMHFSTYASHLVLGYLPEMTDRFTAQYAEHGFVARIKLWLRSSGTSYFALYSSAGSTTRVWAFPHADPTSKQDRGPGYIQSPPKAQAFASFLAKLHRKGNN